MASMRSRREYGVRRTAARHIHQGIEQRPVRYGVRAVFHCFGFPVRRGNRTGVQMIPSDDDGCLQLPRSDHLVELQPSAPWPRWLSEPCPTSSRPENRSAAILQGHYLAKRQRVFASRSFIRHSEPIELSVPCDTLNGDGQPRTATPLATDGRSPPSAIRGTTPGSCGPTPTAATTGSTIPRESWERSPRPCAGPMRGGSFSSWPTSPSMPGAAKRRRRSRRSRWRRSSASDDVKSFSHFRD